MIRKKKDKIKEEGDQLLVSVIEELQNQLTLQKDLDQTTLDMSDDNLTATAVLRAKYNFLYSEARHRHTIFSGISNAISQ